MAARRDEWRGEVMPGLGAGRVVFLDETAAKTNMARTHGYAPKGQRLEGYAPYRRWQTTTFLGAMRQGGFLAPLVVDGAMTSELFLAYVQRVLVPELGPGSVVVMDNLSCHTQQAVRLALETAGHTVLYQPPYSPRTSTRSSWRSASSRGCCARRPPAPSRRCGRRWAGCWTGSAPTSAATTSATAAMPLHHPEERSKVVARLRSRCIKGGRGPCNDTA